MRRQWTRCAKKARQQTRDRNSVKSLTIAKKFSGRFLSKFALKWIWKIPPHLAYVAILPFETKVSAKQAINDKLQGSVATYLTCGGVVNNQIKKGFCWVCEWIFFLNWWIYGKSQARAWLSHALCAHGQHTAEHSSAQFSRVFPDNCYNGCSLSLTLLLGSCSPQGSRST